MRGKSLILFYWQALIQYTHAATASAAREAYMEAASQCDVHCAFMELSFLMLLIN